MVLFVKMLLNLTICIVKKEIQMESVYYAEMN